MGFPRSQLVMGTPRVHCPSVAVPLTVHPELASNPSRKRTSTLSTTVASKSPSRRSPPIMSEAATDQVRLDVQGNGPVLPIHRALVALKSNGTLLDTPSTEKSRTGELGSSAPGSVSSICSDTDNPELPTVGVGAVSRAKFRGTPGPISGSSER